MRRVAFILALMFISTLAIAGEPMLVRDRLSAPIQGALRPIVNQTVAYDNSVGNPTLFTSAIIRVTATTDCFVLIGADNTVTATAANGMFLVAGWVEYLKVGSQYTGLAVIKKTTAGTLYVSEME